MYQINNYPFSQIQRPELESKVDRTQTKCFEHQFDHIVNSGKDSWTQICRCDDFGHGRFLGKGIGHENWNWTILGILGEVVLTQKLCAAQRVSAQSHLLDSLQTPWTFGQLYPKRQAGSEIIFL